MDQARQKLLIPLLQELCQTIEELLLAGLTTASQSTVERLDVSFKEASRMQLLRLGSTLRIANEEISRFTTGSTQFSAKRLAFFLGRAWLLATGLRRAIDAGDNAAIERLTATPPTAKLDRLQLIMLGVTKRVVPGAFAAFDFRLRTVEPASPLPAGEPLVWSCVFPMRKDLDLPAEAFLHLPQKQKFKPSVLLEKRTVEMTQCAVSRQPAGPTRLMLSDASTVTPGDPFNGWEPFWNWNLPAAAQRLTDHRPTPLDLEVELQEEILIRQWEAGPRQILEDGYDLLPLKTEHLPLEARLDRGPSGIPLAGVMEKMAARKKRPALYGLAHYEACSIIFQPLTALGKDGPEYLTISPDKVSQAELVKAMKFT